MVAVLMMCSISLSPMASLFSFGEYQLLKTCFDMASPAVLLKIDQETQTVMYA